jgi:uncharacterized membrane protein
LQTTCPSLVDSLLAVTTGGTTTQPLKNQGKTIVLSFSFMSFIIELRCFEF